MKKRVGGKPVTKAETVIGEVTEPVIEKIEAEVVATGTVAANMLNIRSGPGINFVPIGTLTSGAVVDYTVENDEWLKLVNGGYVMRKFIQ